MYDKRIFFYLKYMVGEFVSILSTKTPYRAEVIYSLYIILNHLYDIKTHPVISIRYIIGAL